MANEKNLKRLRDIWQIYPTRDYEHIYNDYPNEYVDIHGFLYDLKPANISCKFNCATKDEFGEFSKFRNNSYAKYNIYLIAKRKYGLYLIGDNPYVNMRTYFQYVDSNGFLYRVKCNNIVNSSKEREISKYTTDENAMHNLGLMLNKLGYNLLSNKWNTLSSKYSISDSDGYKYNINLNTLIHRGHTPEKFNTSNKYSFDNIKIFLDINNLRCKIVDTEYTGINHYIEWECLECKNIYKRKLSKQQELLSSHTINGLCRDCSNKINFDGGYSIKNMIKDNLSNKYSKINAKVYFIKIENDTELFFKIGITKTSYYNRFRSMKPYSENIDLVSDFKTNLCVAIYLEYYLHNRFSDSQYYPNYNFKGYTECFKDITVKQFNDAVLEFNNNKNKIIKELSSQYD